MKKILSLCFVTLITSGCSRPSPTTSPNTDTSVQKKCSYAMTYLIVEKSEVLNQVGEKSFVLASEFQSDPILLSVSPEMYSTLSVGKSYYVTFEGFADMPNSETNLIPTLVVQQIEEVEPRGLENPQQPLTCQ